MLDSITSCVITFIFIFIFIFILIRWYTNKYIFVSILLSYWLSFLVFLVCISDYCNRTEESLPSMLQQLIILTILSSLVFYTFGMIYIITLT